MTKQNTSGGLETEYRAKIQVVSIGETMLRMSPRAVSTLEEANCLDVYVAGAESNVAVGLCRMGIASAWISKLVDNPLGRSIISQIRGFGVDTQKVVWSDTGRVGVCFSEVGVPPRPSRVIYDRADSAFTSLQLDEIDWEYVRRAQLVHLTGITPALGCDCRHLTEETIAFCNANHLALSLDVNYRQGLWSPQEAHDCLSQLIPYVSLLICSIDDAIKVFGIHEADAKRALEVLLKRFSVPAAVLTLGAKGAIAFDGERFLEAPAYPSEAVDRIGRGDSFTAGVLSGYLKGDLNSGLRVGNAMAALNQTLKGDFFRCSSQDIERVVGGSYEALSR